MEELRESLAYLENCILDKKKLVKSTKECIAEIEEKIKEDMRMVELLTNTVDPNHSIFSPHQDQEIEGNLRKLQKEIEEQEEQKDKQRQLLKNIEEELEQVNKIYLILNSINEQSIKEESIHSEKQELGIEVSPEDKNPQTYNTKIEEKGMKDDKNSSEENSNKLELEILADEEQGLYALNHSIGIKVLETQENERQRIARELHDTVVQNLTGLVHKTELCTKLLDIDIIRARLELLTMQEALRSTIDDLRDTIYNLRPMSLNDLGLVITVERLLSSIQINHRIQTVFHVEGTEQETTPVINLTIYRVIQEACNNIIKHANAASIVVTIAYKENEIGVEIQDDGDGFSVQRIREDQQNGHGLGLSIMKERIYLLSGDLELDTQEGRGTKIKLYVPFHTEEEEK